MAVSSAVVSVGTSATALNASITQGSRLKVAGGAAILYVGGSNVTTANGYPIAISGSLTVDLDAGEILYGVVASATQATAVLIT